jgi:hypothetical protein
MAKRKKSLDQLIQLAMSVYYNWDITTERKIRDMTSLLPPPDWGLHLEFATMVDKKGTSAENAYRGTAQETAPPPNQDPALSKDVTTGGLSAPISRWKARCHLLWIERSQPLVHAPLLGALG